MVCGKKLIVVKEASSCYLVSQSSVSWKESFSSRGSVILVVAVREPKFVVVDEASSQKSFVQSSGLWK